MDNSYDNNLRRLFHIISISTLALIYGFSNLTGPGALPYLLTMTITIVGIDVLRIEIPTINNWFSFMLRTHERESLSGASWSTIAALIIVSLFSKPIAVLSFLYLAIGDPIASYVGIKMRERPTKQKSFIGSVGFFIPCAIIGWLWLLRSVPESAFFVAIVTAAVAALVERYSEDMDDNLLIPLVTASTCAILI